MGSKEEALTRKWSGLLLNLQENSSGAITKKKGGREFIKGETSSLSRRTVNIREPNCELLGAIQGDIKKKENHYLTDSRKPSSESKAEGRGTREISKSGGKV